MIPASDRAAGALLFAIGVCAIGVLMRLCFVTDPVTSSICAVLSLFGAALVLMGADLATGLAVTRILHKHPSL